MQIRITKKSKASIGGFFTRSLNKYLEKKAKASQRPRRNAIRPSEIGYCSRMIVLSILNLYSPPVPTPRLQRIFDNGNSVHERYLQDYLKDMEDEKDIEVLNVEKKFKSDYYWLKGSPDAIIVNKENNKHYVLELKSIKDEDFYNLDKPLDAHVAQIRIYMFMTGTKNGIIVYENKDSQDTKEFEIAYNKVEENKLLKKVEDIKKYILEYPRTKKLPPKCKDPRCKACKES